MIAPVFGAQQIIARVAQARRLGLADRRRRVPRARPPLLIESDYAARLVALVHGMRAAAEHVLVELPWLLRTDSAELRVDDDTRGRRARQKMERVRSAAESAVDEHAVEGVARDFGRRVSAHQKGELLKQGKAALGVDLHLFDPKVADKIGGFVHENVALIKKLRGATLDEIEAIVTRAVASGTRAETVAGEIAARFDVSERHARLVARDQIGKLNSQITEARHAELGIKSFIWRSMRDARVRPRHVTLDGQQFQYDKPPAEGLPGRPVCCRCVPEPVFDDIYAELDALGV